MRRTSEERSKVTSRIQTASGSCGSTTERRGRLAASVKYRTARCDSDGALAFLEVPTECQFRLSRRSGQAEAMSVGIGEASQLDLAGNQQGLALKHDAGGF